MCPAREILYDWGTPVTMGADPTTPSRLPFLVALDHPRVFFFCVPSSFVFLTFSDGEGKTFVVE